MSDHKKGYMVVETNHRVYAYTGECFPSKHNNR